MLFNSYIFLCVFLPISLIVYYLLAHKLGSRAAKIFLCIDSFVFYGWWNPAFILLLLGSIAFNYLISLRLKGEEQRTPNQGWVLGFGVAANLGLLCYYKYLFPLLGFFHSIGLSHIDFGDVILPIGISFFTFTQIGYLVDCHQGLVKERGLLNYVLFVTFFPHLIAGPILHHREVMPQFANEDTYRLKLAGMVSGLTLFAMGMVKKVLLADYLAPWAETGFSSIDHIQFFHAWSVALAYSMQLYFDFSGYSDMAIGLGIMFGVRLPLNFNSPYKATSVIDFWQRWHMTLTRYLTLLLYNPIALWINRRRQQAGLAVTKKAASTVRGFTSIIAFPTFTTMFLAGVWHGAGLQFIVFGMLHGFYLTVNHAWRILRTSHSKSAGKVKKFPMLSVAYLSVNPIWRILRPSDSKSAGEVREFPMLSVAWKIALTYMAVLIAQVYFRANNVSEGSDLVAGLFGFHGSGLPFVIPANDLKYMGSFAAFLIDHNYISTGLREIYNTVTLPIVTNTLVAIAFGVITFGFPNVYQILGDASPALTKVKPDKHWQWVIWKPNLISAVLVGVLLFVTYLYFDRTARFLYFQF